MEWNVFHYNINKGTIETYNVLSHRSFVLYIKKAYNSKTSKDEFMEQLRREAMYYFWSKSEHEIIISGWPPREGTDRKVDVYEQLKANWKHFSEYIWTLLENNSL